MLQDELNSFVTLQTIAGTIATYWAVATIYNFLSAPSPPSSIPWLGYGAGWIASLRNFFAFSQGKAWVTEGYHKFSKHNKVFVLPATLGMAAEVVVPRSQMSWMLDQPDSVLSTKDAHYDFLQGNYSFVEPVILREPYHEHVIHKHLVRNLNTIVPDLADEVPRALEAVFGTDTSEYKTIEILDAFMRMVPRLTNRMLVGPKLAHEKTYLDAVLAFTNDAMRTQLFICLTPKAFHPIVGNLLGLASTYHYWVSSKFTLPLIRKRIEDIQKKEAGDPEHKDWKEPQDFVTWSYRTACAEGRLDEAHPLRIAKRIMPINFASIHTTSLTAYDALVNILCAGPSVVESLREEAYKVLQEEGGWTKQGLSRMHRMDSAIRESQRTSPLALTFVGRKVIAKQGVTTPEGIRLDYGTLLSCPWGPVAEDEELQGNTAKFDAFRYSRPREEYEAMSSEEKAKVDVLKLKQTSLVTTSDRYLAFGHGRHACPGRFFISHELKMIFAELFLNYDVQPILEEPVKTWIIRFRVPGPVKIQAKRRKSPWQPNSA